VVVVLNRKRFEPALPNVARGAVMAMVAAGNAPLAAIASTDPDRRLDPFLRSTENGWASVNNQEDLPGHACRRRSSPSRKRRNHRACGTPARAGCPDSIHASNRGTRGSWHATNIEQQPTTMSIKRYVPLFMSIKRYVPPFHFNKALFPFSCQ
jgi:hypothetical protein